MSPPVLETRTGGGLFSFANVTFYDIEVAVESPPIAPDVQTGAFAVQQTWTIVSGLSEEWSILGSGFTFFDLAGTPSSVNSPGVLAVSGQVRAIVPICIYLPKARRF